MRHRILALSLLLLTGCSVAPLERLTASLEADSLVRQADAQLRADKPAAAIRILEDVARRFPDAQVHDKALYELQYEINNRPEWVLVPIEGLIRLAD